MKARDKKTNQQRRNFLRGTAAASAGVVLTTAASGVAVADATDKRTDRTSGKKAGYQLSQHILDYYKTCAR
jgi:hypothetical protein